MIRIFKKNKEKATSPKKEEVVKVIDSKNQKTGNFGVSILRRVLLSEKSQDLRKINQYLFLVSPKSNKNQVREEISRRYGVKVKTVNIVNQKGKTKRWRSQLGKRPDLKKAIVTLAKGEKIEIS